MKQNDEHQIDKQELKQQTKSNKRLADNFESIRTEKTTSNVFKSFIPKPKNIRFGLQHDDEEIFLVLRQHPTTQLKTFLILIFSIFFVPWLLQNSGLIAMLPVKFRALLYIFLIIVLFGVTLNAFLLWFFSVNIITNERIIDVDFLSIIYKNISVTKNRNIQDVTKKTSGIMASIFDYGTVYIQTAGAKNEFEFDHVPHPAQVTKLMNEIMRRQRKNQETDEQEVFEKAEDSE